MIVDTKFLVTVKTYSAAHGRSLSWGYKQINEKIVDTVEVDSVMFILTAKPKKANKKSQ